jgi:hypothetical protein
MLGDRNQGEVQQDQGFEMRVQLYLYSNKATGLDITPELPLYIKEKSPLVGEYHFHHPFLPPLMIIILNLPFIINKPVNKS